MKYLVQVNGQTIGTVIVHVQVSKGRVRQFVQGGLPPVKCTLVPAQPVRATII